MFWAIVVLVGLVGPWGPLITFILDPRPISKGRTLGPPCKELGLGFLDSLTRLGYNPNLRLFVPLFSVRFHTNRWAAIMFSRLRWVFSLHTWVKGTKADPLFARWYARWLCYLWYSCCICDTCMKDLRGVPEALGCKTLEDFDGILSKDLEGFPRHLGVRPWRVSM